MRHIHHNPVEKNAQSRCGRGHVLLELSCSSFMLLVFTILSADMGVLIYGAEFNDRACRDAARAAAQGSDLNESTKLIKATLKAHAGDGNYITSPALQNVVYNDYGGSPPPQVAPYVTVTTKTVARAPFAPLVFFKGPVFLQNGVMTFMQTYTFPIVKTK
ncbi:MAG TPA: hypothetical protein V6C76_16165 [Drouetiella sp.]